MPFKLGEIATALGAEILGDASIEIDHARAPHAAGPNDLALAMSPAYGPALSRGRARAAIVWPDADWRALGLRAAIKVARARLAMSVITRTLDRGPAIPTGVHSSAVIGPGAEIGENPAIGPFVHIAAGARIGPNARIDAHASIGVGATVGADALILAGVRIGARVRIGERFIAHPGVVIGGDGFSFVTPEESGVERARKSRGDQGPIVHQRWVRIHSLGGVHIGDDVEIGANSCVDRGTVADTTIGDRTKTDNLVQIGHNVRVGHDCLICGQVGVAGSARIGNRVVLGGQCGVSDNITVGDDVVAGAATIILTRVASGAVILGSPAMPMKNYFSLQKAMRRLPRLAQRVADLEGALRQDAPPDDRM